RYADHRSALKYMSPLPRRENSGPLLSEAVSHPFGMHQQPQPLSTQRRQGRELVAEPPGGVPHHRADSLAIPPGENTECFAQRTAIQASCYVISTKRAVARGGDTVHRRLQHDGQRLDSEEESQAVGSARRVLEKVLVAEKHVRIRRSYRPVHRLLIGPMHLMQDQIFVAKGPIGIPCGTSVRCVNRKRMTDDVDQFCIGEFRCQTRYKALVGGCFLDPSLQGGRGSKPCRAICV